MTYGNITGCYSYQTRQAGSVPVLRIVFWIFTGIDGMLLERALFSIELWLRKPMFTSFWAS